MSRPLRASDLAGADGLEATAPEIVDALATAHELDVSLAAADVHASATFADRVMEAIAAEPLPQPAMAAGLAVRRGRVGVLIGALADTWRVATTGGRPFAVRAQAAAFVIVAVLAFTSLGAIAAGGALHLLGTESTGSGEPGSVASPGSTASPPASEAPIDSPGPSDSATPAASVEPSAAPSGTSAPVRTPSTTASPTRTPRPIATPTPEASSTPEPTPSPWASPTPSPHETETP